MESIKTERSKSAQPGTREVPFTVRAKGASEVVVTGDFTQWTRDGIGFARGPTTSGARSWSWSPASISTVW